MNNQQRTHELENLARQNNWSFTSTALSSNLPSLQEFEFQTGEKRNPDKIENLIETENIKIFDIYWKTEFKVADALGPLSHKNTSAQNIEKQTMFLYESENLQLKKFYVYPSESNNWLNNWLDKTFLQSNFSDYPEFEKRWVVRGSVKQLLNKDVIEFYQNSDKFWTFASANNLFIYQSDVLIEASQISDWVKRIETLAKLLM